VVDVGDDGDIADVGALGHLSRVAAGRAHTSAVDDDDRPPICPACGVTMVPAALSERERPDGGWVCLECEETGDERA
jgi:hypothetical protein